MTKKKILFIATGGTFSAIETEEGLKPHFDPEQLIDKFPESRDIADIEGVQIAHLDSTNVHPENWTVMADYIGQNYERADGFIIGHGTDTLAQTAAALSFAVRNIAKPIVMTGSVFSTEKPHSRRAAEFSGFGCRCGQ